MWVVKLGGSLFSDTATLTAWLRAIVKGAPPSTVIVPGGGPFADAVRGLQGRLGFGELAAHRMAILAMQQAAMHLHALEPRLHLAETEIELHLRGPKLWLPWQVAGRSPALAASWSVTSDSIAAWLAAHLAATHLVLVKSAALPGEAATAEALAQAGLVDEAFPAAARRFSGRIVLLSRDRLPEQLGEDALRHGCDVAR